MNSYLVRPPRLYRWFYGDAIFRGSESEKIVYLTFDDGPNAEATPYTLDVLKSHGVKATFFVLGKNVLEYSDLVERAKKEGHQVANHGMNHINGWKSGAKSYVFDVGQGKALIGSNFFRPPYGKLSPFQYYKLRKTEKLVFWDVISGDFDTAIDGKQVVRNVLANVRNGSIIVMHDSKKALTNLKGSLDQIISELVETGYRFETINALIEPKID